MSALGPRVEALREDNAAVFDGPGLGLIESLLARAETLGGEAGARLAARASLRIEALEAALASATLEVTRELDALGDAAPEEARELLARGDRRGARRALRRARADVARARERSGVSWVARLAADATSRGDDGLALFRRSAESARATVAIARSTDNVPVAAGRYNSHALAVRALAEMAELSPEYARVIVAAIDDLAAVEAALGASPPSAKARRVGKRRTRSREP